MQVKADDVINHIGVCVHCWPRVRLKCGLSGVHPLGIYTDSSQQRNVRLLKHGQLKKMNLYRPEFEKHSKAFGGAELVFEVQKRGLHQDW